MDEHDTNHDIVNRKMNGMSCLYTIIRGTYVGRSIWRISDGCRRTWRGAMEKVAVLPSPAQPCSQGCCVAAVVDESSRSSIAETVVGCPGITAAEIGATAVPARA